MERVRHAGRMWAADVARSRRFLEVRLALNFPDLRDREYWSYDDYRAFLRRHQPDLFAHHAPVMRAMVHWVGWNRLVEKAAGARSGLVYHRYRVEDLDQAAVGDLVEMIGGKPRLEELVGALALIPKSTNTRRRAEGVTWESLPDGGVKDDLEELAGTYGYPAGV
jgi:hypothetical protein